MQESKEKVEGLGGWLIIPILGLIFSAFVLIKSLYQDHLPIYQDGIWEVLTNPASNAYHNLWAPMLIFEVVVNSLLLIFCLIVIVYFFKKSYLFPKLFIIYHVVALTILIVDYYIMGLIPAAIEIRNNMGISKEILKYIISLLIWVPYILYSQRVKNTFAK